MSNTKKDLTCIGACGQRRAGKNVLADYLCGKLVKRIPVPAHGGGVYNKTVWGQRSFAAPVKQIFCETFQKDLDFVEEWKVKDEVPEGMAMPVRQALTFIGDGFRKIQPDIWIELAFRPENDPDSSIFTDVRYINEARKIKIMGGMTILVYREGHMNWDDNGSEAQIRPYIMWCIEKNREGHIASWEEFQNRDLSFKTDKDFEAFFNSLPEEMRSNGNQHLKDMFFENLGQFDLFIRAHDGVENIYHKADQVVMPYIRDNYTVEEIILNG